MSKVPGPDRYNYDENEFFYDEEEDRLVSWNNDGDYSGDGDYLGRDGD